MLVVAAPAGWADDAENGYFYGVVDGNSFPTGTGYFVVYVYDSDASVEWYSNYLDAEDIPVEYESDIININEGPFDLQCRVYSNSHLMIGEQWIYDETLPGHSQGVEVNFWFGS